MLRRATCAGPHDIENPNTNINSFSSVQAAAPQAAEPHGIENRNQNINSFSSVQPYLNMQLGAFCMEEVLKLDIPSPMPPLRCIFRVPHRLRGEPEKAVHYTPQVISIGPLHHKNPALKPMEEHKKRYLQYFMSRGTNNLSRMNEYKERIKKDEAKLRSCYSETIDLESDEFVQIILVDAIFIIEFLIRNWCSELLDENDCIFGKPGMVGDLWPDLLMLENQLPFFILVDLFDPDMFPVNNSEKLSILSLSYYFLNGVPTFGGRSDDWKTICSSEVEHFVDLLRKLCIACQKEKEKEKRKMLKKQLGTTRKGGGNEGAKYTTAPSIKELHLAGVKFKKTSTKNMFDIQFKCGILKIPKLKTDDRTELNYA